MTDHCFNSIRIGKRCILLTQALLRSDYIRFIKVLKLGRYDTLQGKTTTDRISKRKCCQRKINLRRNGKTLWHIK
ncbi:unnamed protein product [Acanthoscelides obtectus]|uniref:Uncharacterized protein n=1 Tax=Acanthoscelides obtectus TaxID=200917 RepID=A0A9P0KQD6_ACAOB|nr:unnamed protein product [Acanthoscelides obtectus]CAK1655163.1 hypothetical protein AOBTE_LOCUS19054 [Acanthoscelides obtectus]